ncbi:hypothetical protein [Tenacibaculum caenipelagi]|uniref:Uncharacterized protein n=1 Tax=Tenacibaculum caenipelagi TaxID=1325435 RepID=A0A4R6TFM5_9FLAO|nr:hypothetical protein [Tenacibaculum caenipelagi]TDQ28613.1 hypothetical protein DFQ07_0990 [Tenacibaculum caenipelagi]
MSKEPIKSNLFRFVTLRSPQLIEDKETGFVSFPEEKKAESLAFQAVQGATTDEERKTALKGAYSTGFTPIASRLEIKNMHEALYQFSGWLMRNKAVLSYAGVEANLNAAQELTTSEEFVLWENLFHQTISKESVAVREGVIQVLVANKFLKAFNAFANSFTEGTEGEIVFTEENEKEFVRLANASVIIPKEVVLAKQNKFSYTEPAVSKMSQEYMQAHLEVASANDKIQQYESSLKELEQAEIVYKKAENVRYSTELKAYDATIEQIRQEAIPDIQTVFEEKTGLLKKHKIYPDLELPKFEFESAPEIDRDESTSTFSVKTLELLNSNELSTYDTFNEIKPILRDKIKKENELVYSKTPQDVQKVSLGGTTLTIDPMRSAHLYSYTGSVNSTSSYSANTILMSLNVGRPDVDVVEASYQLTDSVGTIYSKNLVRKISEVNGLLNLEFFSEWRSLYPMPTKNCTFSGELTLSNGVKLSFSTSFFITEYDRIFGPSIYRGTYSGVAVEVIEDTGTTEDTAEGGAEKTVLYGVSQLGIADFRRVEQEVCCYVPGEVSHIENIMAREYKERSTRNLTVSEQITEKTTEKEVENLTDTTSTERNELQNEASSIVNSDNATSFGANASVSTEFAKTRFSAGVNYNNSSSTSASDSNLQAQTYAQEVTERALERVVQKISTKRTSRMLREYEENNTHGFDNRKGDKHVTGVYRWVDKIYKNKLINYGKRLMYEFALPEPAKFYIESYLKNGEGKETTFEGLRVLKEPIHPSKLHSTYAISSSKELDENNYQLLASEYNAEIKVKPTKEIYVSESFKLDSTKTVNAYESSSITGKIEIPEGYESLEVSVSYSGVEDDKAANAKGFFINVGNVKISNRENQPKLHNDATKDMLGHSGSVAVSATQVDFFTGSLNVVIKCELAKQGIEQWQNEAYKAIMDAYNERLLEYNEFMQSQTTEDKSNEKKKELSSQINRSIEKRELKRIALDLIKHKEVITARDNYKDDNGDVNSKHVVRTEKFQEHAKTVKFFEQAFDWEIMAYTFYPYFYGAEDNWDANFEYNEGSDPIFQAFLQSGMARAVVPVRPGFEEAVNWYMKTGETWLGQGMVTDMDDDLYVSVAEEMQTIEGEVEGTWETRVPTTLTVLQADSVVLKEGGLPCNTDCGDHTLFESSTDKIGDALDGVDYDIVGETNNVA